jgi:hypothetical protein
LRQELDWIVMKALEKDRLRQQALGWLKADLAHWSKETTSAKPADRDLARQRLQRWKQDTDLAGVRGPALAKLPKDEAEAWSKLWQEVDALLARAGEKASPKKPSAAS